MGRQKKEKWIKILRKRRSDNTYIIFVFGLLGFLVLAVVLAGCLSPGLVIPKAPRKKSGGASGKGF